MTCKSSRVSHGGKQGVPLVKPLIAHDGGLALIRLSLTIVKKKKKKGRISSQPVVNTEHQAVLGGFRCLCFLSLL